MLDEVNQEAEDVQGMLGQANKGVQNLIKAVRSTLRTISLNLASININLYLSC